MSKLLLKPNALRAIFEIGTPGYENFDENAYRAAKKSERTRMRNSLGKPHTAFKLSMGPVVRFSDPADPTINRNRWGHRTHREHKGSIYYGFQDAIIATKTTFVVGFFSEDLGFRKKQGGQPVLFFQGIQTPESLWVDEILLNKTPQEPDTQFQKIPPETPYLQRAFLLAYRSYEQISSDTGMTPEENLRWAEKLSEPEVLSVFDEKWGDLTL